jgi:hypothetical protein
MVVGGRRIRTGFMAQKLFGEVAFEMGFVSTDQLYKALTIQAKDEVEKKPYRSLGQILIDLGHMNEKQVLEVLQVLHGPKASKRIAKRSPKRS